MKKVKLKLTWKKVLGLLALLMFFPLFWWLYIIAVAAYFLYFKNHKDLLKNINKDKFKKGIGVPILILVGVIMFSIYLSYINGSLLINDLPKITNNKNLLVKGTSSYKNGEVLIKFNELEIKEKINNNGEYSKEIELKEGINQIEVIPISEKGKKGWSEKNNITLDTVSPDDPKLESNPDKTNEEKIEISILSEPNSKIEVKKSEQTIISKDLKEGKEKLVLNLDEGDNNFIFYAFDKAGNRSKNGTTYKIVREKKIIANEQVKKLFSVSEVVDGDTIKVDIDGKIETLRLIGIDTPEVVDPRTVVQCFGKEASEKAKEILGGKKISLEADNSQGERDKYNRLLRYVFLEDGTNFNKFMIENGYAHEYTYNSPYKYQSEFKAAENSAKNSSKGLWSTSTCNGDTTKVAATPTPTTPAPTTTYTPTKAPAVAPSSGSSCDPNYSPCVPNVSYDLDCGDIGFKVKVIGVDRHKLDGNKDGWGCESY